MPTPSLGPREPATVWLMKREPLTHAVELQLCVRYHPRKPKNPDPAVLRRAADRRALATGAAAGVGMDGGATSVISVFLGLTDSSAVGRQRSSLARLWPAQACPAGHSSVTLEEGKKNGIGCLEWQDSIYAIDEILHRLPGRRGPLAIDFVEVAPTRFNRAAIPAQADRRSWI